MTERERQITDDVLHVLFGRSLRIATVAALCFAAGLALTAAWGVHYTASVRLMAAAGPGRSARDQAELLRDPASVLRVLPGLLASRPPPGAWASALTRLGLTAPETPGAFAARASRAMAVRNAGTNIIQASFTWADPVFAARALNLIVTAHQRTGAAGAATHEAVAQAQARVLAAQSELDALDRQPAGAESADALRADLARVQERLRTSRATADQVRLDRALAQVHAEALRKTYQGGGWVEIADADGGSHPLTSGLATLLDKRQQLLAAGKQDAALRALDREMARAREQAYAAALQIAEGRSAALEDRLAKLSAEIADGEAASTGLARSLSRTELLVQARQAKSAELAAAQATVLVAHARLAPGWQSAELVSAALPPPAADWPHSSLLVLLSAAGALAAGLASAARAEARRVTIDRPGDLPRLLGIDMLACLTELPAPTL